MNPPEEAISAIMDAIEAGRASDLVDADTLARRALEAAAPLIAAQVLREAAAMLEQAAADTQPPSRHLTAFAAAVATGMRITANGRERSPASGGAE